MKYILSALIVSTLLLASCSTSPETAMQRGFDCYDLNKYGEALPLLEKAFQKGIDDPELVVRLAFCKAHIQGDGLTAINILRESAAKYPKYARTYYELGYIAQNFGPVEGQQNIRQAIGFTRKAVQLDTTEYKFRDNLGMFFFMINELDSAQYWFSEAKKLKSDDPELNARIAQIVELKARKASNDSLASLDTAGYSITVQP